MLQSTDGTLAASPAPTPAAASPNADLQQQLAFPPPSKLHGTSYLESDLSQDASNFVDEYPHLNVNATEDDADFTPAWDSEAPSNGALAYAMYQYDLPDYDRDAALSLFWKQASDVADCWIGVANWQSDSWDWFGLPASGPIALSFINHWYFPGGKVVIAVVVADNQLWKLDYLRIGTPLESLDPPENVQATDGTDAYKVEITWDKTVGATGYKVYRDLQSNLIAIVGEDTVYDDTDTEWNDEHTYWVKAFNSITESDFSESDTGWRKEGPPNPPTNVQASDGLSMAYIEITWTKVPGATGYALYYDTPENQKVPDMGDVDVWQDYLVLGTSPHEYWVASINEHGVGPLSDSDTGYLADPSAQPGLPTNLQASDDEYNDRIKLTWTKANAASGYYIYRDNQDDYYTQVFDTDSWSDMNVPDTNQHEYWLKAFNVNGESDFSDPDWGSRTEPIVPGKPTNLQATDGDYNDKIVLTWTKAVDAVSYNVFRGLQTVMVAEDIGDVDTWEDTDVPDCGSDHTYNYWVQGISIDDKTGPKSDPDSGWRAPNLPDPPADLQASDGDYNDRISLSWTKSDGATGYKIYRDIQTNLVAQIGDVDAWDDMFVEDSGSDHTHTYWLKALNDDGDSDFSDPDTGWRAPNPPGAPTELEASDGDFSDRIRLTWTKADGATGYYIYRDDNSGDPYHTVGDVDTWDDVFIIPDYTTYTYWLKAFNDDGDSDFSNSDTGYAQEEP